MLAKLIADSSLSVTDLQGNKFYQEVYKGTNSDRQYTGFNLYKDVINDSVINDLKHFFSSWQLSGLSDEELNPLWKEKKDFYLIPHYLKQEDGISVSEITQVGRVVSFAVCRYFEVNKQYDKSHFKDWMYFVWNVAENSNIATEDAMIGAIRLMKELSVNSGDILTFLASDSSIESKFAERQIAEERFKARLMLGLNSDWRKKIREAESNDFLKGNLSCLLRKDSKEYVDDLDMFEQKYQSLCKYFDSDGLKEEYRVLFTKALIRCCHSFEQLGHGSKCFIFDSSADNWKQRFLNDSVPSYFKEVNQLLMADDLKDIEFESINEYDSSWSENTNNIKHILSEGQMVDNYIVFSGSEWRLNHFRDNVWALYPSRARHAYVFDWHSENYTFIRNELLHLLLEEKKITLLEQPSYKEHDGVYGDWNISFVYNGYGFLWCWNNYIFLLDENNQWIEREGSHSSDERENHYRLVMDGRIGLQGFLGNLTRLAHEYYK